MKRTGLTIEAAAVTAVRGRRTILGPVDARVRPGEFVGLVGPNGAGKSTLLRVLAGLEAPEQGTVSFGGRPLPMLPNGELARRLAYLGQEGRVHWPISAERVVALGRLPHRQARAGHGDAAAVARAMAAMEILDLRDRPVAGLSGGERMRVLIARALAVEADALLADEPTSGLDPAHQLHVLETFARLAREGVAVVAVLHDLSLALRFCDRLLLMAGGLALADGRPADVLDAAALRATYGITAHHGRVDGLPFIIPVQRVGRLGAGGAGQPHPTEASR